MHRITVQRNELLSEKNRLEQQLKAATDKYERLSASIPNIRSLSYQHAFDQYELNHGPLLDALRARYDRDGTPRLFLARPSASVIDHERVRRDIADVLEGYVLEEAKSALFKNCRIQSWDDADNDTFTVRVDVFVDARTGVMPDGETPLTTNNGAPR